MKEASGTPSSRVQNKTFHSLLIGVLEDRWQGQCCQLMLGVVLRFLYIPFFSKGIETVWVQDFKILGYHILLILIPNKCRKNQGQSGYLEIWEEKPGYHTQDFQDIASFKYHIQELNFIKKSSRYFIEQLNCDFGSKCKDISEVSIFSNRIGLGNAKTNKSRNVLPSKIGNINTNKKSKYYQE